jgi:hypothetical protein
MLQQSIKLVIRATIMNKFQSRIEAQKIAIEGTKQMLSQQGRTALQMHTEIIGSVNSVGKIIKEQSTIDLLKQLEFIALETGEVDFDKNKSIAMNKVHTTLNKMVPLLVVEAEKGFSLKNDRTLYKKDKERFQAVIDQFKDNSIHLYMSVGYNSLEIKAKCHYKDGFADRSGYTPQSSYENTAYFWDINQNKSIFSPLPLIDHQEIKSAKIRIQEIDKLISELKSEKSSLQHKIGA